MCGTVSAVSLTDREREHWPLVRERLRVPGASMALLRGLLGDAEVAAVAAVRPDGAVTPVAVLATADAVAEEIALPADGAGATGVRPARIGDYDVEVLLDRGRCLAVLATPWIDRHLLLYTRTMWRRRVH